MKHLILGAVAIVAIGVMLLLLTRDRDRGYKEGFFQDGTMEIKGSDGNDININIGRGWGDTTSDLYDQGQNAAFREQIATNFDMPEDTPQAQLDRYEKIKQFVEDQCKGPISHQLTHLAERPFTMIWGDDDENRRLDPEEYNSDVTFYAYGEDDRTKGDPDVTNIKSYKEHISEMAALINETQVENKVPVVQDPRCSFVEKNLPESDKFIFFNNNKLLSHPDGPLEPNKCYIPPYVANVLYHDKLCTADNELIYHDRFKDIVEIEGLDVSARVDKDLGTPMCVLKFKTEEESPLSGNDYKEKLEEYLQYLYKMDPERQYWKESTQWLFNKNYEDQKIIALHMADKEWLNNRLISVQSLLDKLRQKVGLKVGETWDQDDGYMQDPTLYINDFIEAKVFSEGDVNHENTKPEDRIANMAESCAYDHNVGQHLIHLQESDFGPNVVDKWKYYQDPQSNRGQMVTDYVTENADFASVWNREGDGDTVIKVKKCEAQLGPGIHQDYESRHGDLGFSKIENGENHFLLRETSSGVAQAHYLDMCKWEDLERVDNAEASMERRADSCGWASTVAIVESNGNYTYNCDEFGKLFKPDDGVTNYFTKLKDVRGSGDVDDELISFLENPRDTGVAAFSNFEDKCIYRNEEEGGCESAHESRFPVAPDQTIPLKGKGNIEGEYDEKRTGLTDTNFTWGPNLIVTPNIGDNGTTFRIEGRALSTPEEELVHVLTNDGSQIKLKDYFGVYYEEVGKTLAYATPGNPNDDIHLEIENGQHYSRVTPNSWGDDQYKPGTATCKLKVGKMIVDEDDWIDAPRNVETGFNVKVSTVDTKNAADPKDSTVKCELKDILADEIYQGTIDESTSAVKLVDYDCGSVTATYGETIHIGEDKDQTSHISPDAGTQGSYHTFSVNGAVGKFNKVTTAGLVRLGGNGNSEGINGIVEPVNLSAGKYDYNGSGVFSGHTCQVTTDTGPSNQGLYHYTANYVGIGAPAPVGYGYWNYSYDNNGVTTLTKIENCSDIGCGEEATAHAPGLFHYIPGSPGTPTPKTQGIYKYTNQFSLIKHDASGVFYVDKDNGTIEAALCPQLRDASEDCPFRESNDPQISCGDGTSEIDNKCVADCPVTADFSDYIHLPNGIIDNKYNIKLTGGSSRIETGTLHDAIVACNATTGCIGFSRQGAAEYSDSSAGNYLKNDKHSGIKLNIQLKQSDTDQIQGILKEGEFVSNTNWGTYVKKSATSIAVDTKPACCEGMTGQTSYEIQTNRSIKSGSQGVKYTSISDAIEKCDKNDSCSGFDSEYTLVMGNFIHSTEDGGDKPMYRKILRCDAETTFVVADVDNISPTPTPAPTPTPPPAPPNCNKGINVVFDGTYKQGEKRGETFGSFGECWYERLPNVSVDNGNLRAVVHQYGMIKRPKAFGHCSQITVNSTTDHKQIQVQNDKPINLDLRHTVFYLAPKTKLTLYHSEKGGGDVLLTMENDNDYYDVLRYDLSTHRQIIEQGWGSEGSFKVEYLDCNDTDTGTGTGTGTGTVPPSEAGGEEPDLEYQNMFWGDYRVVLTKKHFMRPGNNRSLAPIGTHPVLTTVGPNDKGVISKFKIVCGRLLCKGVRGNPELIGTKWDHLSGEDADALFEIRETQLTNKIIGISPPRACKDIPDDEKSSHSGSAIRIFNHLKFSLTTDTSLQPDENGMSLVFRN